MIRGDYIHHRLPQKEKNNARLVRIAPRKRRARAELVGAVWYEKWRGYREKLALGWSKGCHPRRLTRRPRSDRLILLRERGGAGLGGGGFWTSYHDGRKKRSSFKNPDHLSLFDTHQSEVSKGSPTPYSHNALRAACLKTDRLI